MLLLLLLVAADFSLLKQAGELILFLDWFVQRLEEEWGIAEDWMLLPLVQVSHGVLGVRVQY